MTTLYDQEADQSQPKPPPIGALILEALTENLATTRLLVQSIRELDETVKTLLLSQ